MSVTMYPNQQQDWQFDGNPNDLINLGQGGTLFLYDRGVDTTTGNWYRCINIGTLDIDAQTITGSQWEQVQTINKSGDATLSLGSATVSLSSLASGNVIHLSYKAFSGTAGAVFISARTNGTGFTITSTSLLDSSTIHWEIK